MRDRTPDSARDGALLLEVVLALGLLVAAGSVIVGGLSTSTISTEELALQAHATDLAVTVRSRMATGVLPVGEADAVSFEPPFEDFTWEANVATVRAFGEPGTSTDSEENRDLGARPVEIIIRHPETGLVHRLGCWLSQPPVRLDASSSAETGLGFDRVREIRELFGVSDDSE